MAAAPPTHDHVQAAADALTEIDQQLPIDHDREAHAYLAGAAEALSWASTPQVQTDSDPSAR